MLIRAGRVFTGESVYAPGLVEIRADRVVAVGAWAPAADDAGPAEDEFAWDYLDATVVPGYVDVHCHGGGGASFSTDEPLDVDRVLTLHRSHGTTTMVASLVTAGLADLRRQVALLTERVIAGDLAGIHLEGPWLAEAFKGAHPAHLLRDPDPDEVAAILNEAGGTVRIVTIAPERTSGLAAVRAMVERGAVAAIGHTDAPYETARAAVEAGARGVTHLFNAMPSIHHRSPGPILALIEDDRLWLELVFDNVHVHPALACWVLRQHGDRVVFVTDAMAAAGQPDGDYTLGELPVEVRGGVARLAGRDTIAGSTLTLDAAVRNAIAAGVPWEKAVRSATILPARYLSLEGVGELRPGGSADLLVLGEDFAVSRVMRRGVWVG